MRATELIPTIGVTDLDEAIEYYVKLGFKKEWKWPEDSPTHASVSLDAIHFMMVKKEVEYIQKADLYIRVEGVVDYHKRMQGAVEGVSELIKTDYGMLDFSFTDPWGHLFSIGEPHGEYQG
jgi:catechol 2,3-dioxygenase-like lactoylglutathione lyase family enzyme